MIQPIYVYGSKVLRETAQPADLSKKEEILTLVTDLKETLKASEGCGLAAPQIGVSLRVAVVDGDEVSETYPELKGFHRTLINPVVLEESQKLCTFSEGCLSVPGVYGDVVRPESMKIEYYDESFEKKTEVLSGFGCRMVQHEMAHLDGELFSDLLAPIRKKIVAKKLQKISKGLVAASYKTKLK